MEAVEIILTVGFSVVAVFTLTAVMLWLKERKAREKHKLP